MQALASLAGLPSRQADDADLDRKMYHVALAGVSRYALNEAVKAIIRGSLGHTFFPSPVELRQECDKAMEPVHRQARRERIVIEQSEENRQFLRVQAAKTPEAKAKVAARYAEFCKGYQKQAAVHESTLDPELVAKVPDARSTFSKAKVA